MWIYANDEFADNVFYLYSRYKVQVAPRDVENGLGDEKSFDPFAERKVENPTT